MIIMEIGTCQALDLLMHSPNPPLLFICIMTKMAWTKA